MPTLHVLRHVVGADPLPALRDALRDAGPTGAWLAPSPALAAEAFAGTAGRAAFAGTLADFANAAVSTHDGAARPLPDADVPPLLAELALQLRDAGELPHLGPSAEGRLFPEQAAAFAREVQDAGGPGRWLQPGASDRLRDAAKLLARYRQACARQHWLDEPSALLRAAELARAGKWPPCGRPGAAVFHGFADFTAAEWELFEAICRGCDDVWVAVPDLGADPRDELLAAPRRLRERLEQLARPRGLFEAGPRLDDRPLPELAASVLASALFRPGPPAPLGPGAANVSIIEAPGVAGEARMVARRVRELLLAGVPAGRVVVTARDWGGNAAHFADAFADHGVPANFPISETLGHSAAFRFALRAWSLPDDGFPFAATAATLRSAWFRPAWPALMEEPELPLLAEALLRAVGEPRGRVAFERAVAAWAEQPPAPLEDEHGDTPRRERLHRLAQTCRPFVSQFFALWDRLPPSGTPKALAERFARFAASLGLPDGDPDWAVVRDALRRAVGGELPPWNGRRPVSWAAFAAALRRWANRQPAAPRGAAGGVRGLAAEDARAADCDYLFVVGLGEGSFPRLAAPASLWGDADRRRFAAPAGPLADPAGRLGAEMRLFIELLGRPKVSVVLTYAAVDEAGQALLPSSFLTAVRELAPDAPVERRRMPVEGYAAGPAASGAEQRWQWAGAVGAVRDDAAPAAGLAPDLRGSLLDARRMARARLRDAEHGPFDGLVGSPAAREELARRFAPERVLSPTALESYVACPFQFLLTHVLRLEPLEDPSEEVELSARGSAVHRALSRFHKEEAARVPAGEVPEALEAALRERLREAVREAAERAPGPAAKALWELEGRRLDRAAGRYCRQWQRFRGNWNEGQLLPQPAALEADFGLPAAPGGVALPALILRHGGAEARVGGRIDRVDAAPLEGGVGFWVLDYKTGSGRNYAPSDAASLKKLQLALYALAVERVLFAGQSARPLGFAYWMTGEDGPKYVLPPGSRKSDGWLRDPEQWRRFRGVLEAWAVGIAEDVRAGRFPLAPRSDPCPRGCPHGPVCRISQARGGHKPGARPLPVVKADSAAGD